MEGPETVSIAATRFGGFAEHVVVGQHDVLALPDALSFEEGAALPVVYGTAYAAVVRLGNVQRGEWILIHAVAGGVGIAATPFARKLGARISVRRRRASMPRCKRRASSA